MGGRRSVPPYSKEKPERWQMQVHQRGWCSFVQLISRRQPKPNFARQVVRQILERGAKSLQQARLGVCRA